MNPLSNEYISGLLGQAAVYGNNSLLGDFRNARAGLGELERLHSEYDFQDGTYYDKARVGLRNQQGSALAGMAVSGLTAAAGITDNAMQASHIQDTSRYENELRDYVDFGNYNYVNYDQLANDMSQNYLSPMPTYNDVRGMNGWEKAGNLASSALTGASAGMTIGGPWGAAIGAGVGLVSSGIGILAGDAKAEKKQQELQVKTAAAQHNSQMNFEAAHERIGGYNFRNGVANARGKGGEIDRKQSITNYANKFLGSPQRRENKTSSVTRIQKNGGCVYRVRVK